ncbi:alpha/beta hydrolase [Nocardioides sp.]|uniref:alpha/beta hydrolase n=1 Tax=Nocardioides sp. TaxID=35761 RepID=UPI0039E348FC
MTFSLDPQLAEIIAGQSLAAGPMPTIARGDALGLRAFADGVLEHKDAAEPESVDVVRTDHRIAVSSGQTILGRWYRHRGRTGRAAVLYFHGGGMVSGSVELYDRFVARYPQRTGVPVLSVDYRLAPEHGPTVPAEDGFAALCWLVEHAEELGVDPSRIAVMGDSGGGGVAAAVAIAARESGVPLAAQILLYPMLDDRTVEPDPLLVPFARWTYDHNYTGWHALLGASLGTPGVSALSAPARLTDFAGLPRTFIDVGELDIFRDESIDYARRLTRAGVSTELYVRRGAAHGFDRIGPADVSDRSWEDRFRFIESL